MAVLKDILYGVALQQVVGSTEVAINELQIDSRKVAMGDCFIAIRGTVVDGHNFIAQCIENGASVIICEEIPAEQVSGVTYVKVADCAKAAGIMASNFYDNPSHKMKVVGVT
ncbi:MAG TPA: Mur ligase domain-containing protein, partial [Chitinophagales bacterium]|nr:Mur ligase domain-containing protein [Chitinophagales bacterium]